MKSFAWLATLLFLTFTLISGSAEAKRLGGGMSSGMQRSTSSFQKSTPARQPTAAPAGAATPPAGTVAPRRSWGGALAGLAAGLGLAALASYFGLGEGMASLMLIALVVIAAVALFGFLLKRRAPQPALAGVGADLSQPAWRTTERVAGGGASPSQPGVAGFDAIAFEREAKVNFIRLQAANDAGNLDDIREFTTPEMFGEFRLALLERQEAKQQTDVVTLQAEVVDVVEEGARYIVSVRFSGMVREQAEMAAQPFDELWHMIKPTNGSGGWLLAGIQQG
jgi:predicted lipid-binding transport protein (Tim44 family)